MPAKTSAHTAAIDAITSELDCDILAALALPARSLNRATWVSLLAACGVRLGARPISTAELQKRIAVWRDAGLISELSRDEWVPSPELRHRLLLALRAAKKLDSWQAAWSTLLCPRGAPSSYWGPPDVHLSEARAHLYAGRHDGLRRALETYQQASERSYHDGASPVHALFGPEPPFEALDLLPDDLAQQHLAVLLDQALAGLWRIHPPALRLCERASIAGDVLGRLALHAAFCGNTQLLAALMPRLQASSPEATAARALVALTSGDVTAARQLAQQACELVTGAQRARLRWLAQPAMPWLCLLLLTSPEPAHVRVGLIWAQLAERGRGNVPRTFAYLLLEQFRRQVDGGAELQLHPSLFDMEDAGSGLWVEQVLGALCLWWASERGATSRAASLRALAARAAHHGYVWLAEELSATSVAKAGSQPNGVLARLYQRQPAWETTLSTLERLLDAGSASVSPVTQEAPQRLVWEVELEPVPTLYGRLQTQTAKGGFNRGKRLSLKRLAAARDAAEGWVTEHDRAVLRHLVREKDYGAERYSLDAHAFTSLCGHPQVWLDSRPGAFINVVKRPPRLVVKQAGAEENLSVSLAPAQCAQSPLVLELEGDDTLVVYELDPALLDVARALARGVTLPKVAEQRLAALMGKLSTKFDVLSDVAGTGLEEVAADERLHIRLWRGASGVRGRVVVQPLAGSERSYRPGQGQATLVFESNGKSIQTHRNLGAEHAREEALLAACPCLAAAERENDDFVIRDLVGSLELLLELRALGDEVVVHWPEGSPLNVGAERKTKDLRLRVGSLEELLTIDGELSVSPELTLRMSELLAAAQKAQGRFIPIGDDQFVALEHHLLKRLEQLAAASTTKGKRTALSSALAPVLEGWLGECDKPSLTEPARQLMERVRDARTLDPDLPPGLDAQLRSYQKEGFEWLCRLAHWGGGACLSDDMGLGKTLQVLALLLRRAPAGPALVVAPTSVCQGWVKEAQRFAPRLNLRRFGVGDRGAQLDTLGPYDVLLSSYGVMQNEIDALESVEFETIVLDEAQAIKNVSAQRTQAALRLSGRFRVATSGTPIENHLGEIWSILNFTNPGLLGSHKRFDERFARPITLDRDRHAAELLRRLVSPFVLRRTKGEVLTELPAKTEITVHVELGVEERALYETIRRKALRALDAEAPQGQQRLRILAELMRLRRAACHPELVTPGSGLPSAKLSALQALIGELREGGHRALVFSQFVDHLNLVRAWLDEAGISHQYLVGATPEKERTRAIEAFQQGQGDLFLISLKAGGFGLNLTQADYVVILDPWWNPAAEDQAADRAHRIGQLRPVTVYRLVARDTVEERIVALHRHKRSLADSLLEGMSEAAPLDLDALRGLMALGAGS